MATIIGITGTNGSGKGAVVNYLRSKGFVYYSVRGVLEQMLTVNGISPDRSALRMRANELRKTNGSDYLIKNILIKIDENAETAVAIESVRTTGEVECLKKKGGILIAIDADRKIRYERIRGRGTATDKIDFDTFVNEEEREWHGAEGAYDMNLMEVMKMADHSIQNNGSLAELHAQIEEVLMKIK